MNRALELIVGLSFGIFTASLLCWYVAGCGWQPKELLIVLSCMAAAFSSGLYLSRGIEW